MTIEEAYTAYSGGMLKYAMYFLKNIHDAEDAVSECFLRLMKSEKFAKLGGEAEKAYIFAALRSVCFTMLKKRAREELIYEREPSEPAADEHIILKADIERALAELSGEQEKMIRMKFLDDMAIKEISAETGLNENNVKIMIFRGKKQLAQALGEQYAS